MRADRDISRRMREMLTQDKVGVRDGFYAALRGDLGHLLASYFEISSPIRAEISQQTDGGFCVNISFSASEIRQFDTTLDIRRE